MFDVFNWQAKYDDGSSLWRRDPLTRNFSSYHDIDRKKLVSFEVYVDNNLLVRLELKKDQVLIWRLRCYQRIGDISPFNTSLIIGWVKKFNNELIKSFLIWKSDGLVVFSSDEEVQFFPEELSQIGIKDLEIKK